MACTHAWTCPQAGGVRTERLVVVRREQHVTDVAGGQPAQLLSQHLVCTRRTLARRRALLLLLLPPLLLLLLMGMLSRVKVLPLLPLAPLPPLARASLLLALVALRVQQRLQQLVHPHRNQEDDLLKLASHLPRCAARRCAPPGGQGPPAEPEADECEQQRESHEGEARVEEGAAVSVHECRRPLTRASPRQRLVQRVARDEAARRGAQ